MSFQYIKTNIGLHLKAINEYKVNAILGILTSLSFILAQIVFVFIIKSQFNDLIQWSLSEYIFYLIVVNMTGTIAGIFSYTRRLNQILLSGEMNIYLSKPVDVLIQYLLNTSQFFVLPEIFLEIIVFIIFLIFTFGDYFKIKLILLIIFLMFTIIHTIIFFRVWDGLAFFMKNNLVFYKIFNESKHITNKYSAPIFKNNLKYFFFLMPNFYYGIISTLFLFNQISMNVFLLWWFVVIIFIIFFYFCLKLIWFFGLKKYEAFN